LLKPVLSVIPILSTAGQRIVGFVDPSLVTAGATISAQLGGEPVRATPADATGRFELYPVPVGTYDLVITASGRVNAVMTGVPVGETTSTVIGSDAVRINTSISAMSAVASGTITVNGSPVDTEAAVRVTQRLAGGPTVEVGYSAANAITGAYGMTLPTSAPTKLAYAAGASAFAFASDATATGIYRLEASAPGFAIQPISITVPPDALSNFSFGP
jgi:hypothetical protein